MARRKTKSETTPNLTLAQEKAELRKNPRKSRAGSPNYTDNDMVQAISIYDMNHSFAETEAETKIPAKIISKWVKERDTKLQNVENIEEKVRVYKQNAIFTVESLMDKALKRIGEALPEATAQQAAMVYGVLFDKHSILVGDAQAGRQTNNIFVGAMPLEEQQELMRRALSRSKKPTIIEATATEEVTAESENTPEE